MLIIQKTKQVVAIEDIGETEMSVQQMQQRMEDTFAKHLVEDLKIPKASEEKHESKTIRKTTD